jgi:hypothetical protein
MNDAQNITVAEFAKALHHAYDVAQKKNDDFRENLRNIEESMRAMRLIHAVW